MKMLFRADKVVMNEKGFFHKTQGPISAGLILLGCLLSACFPLYAQSMSAGQMSVSDLTPELRFSLDFAHTVIEIGEEIEQRFPEKIKRLSNADELSLEESRRLFEFQNKRFTNFYEKHIFTSQVPEAKKEFFRRMMMSINHTSFHHLLKKQVAKAHIFFRRSGLGMAIALTTATVINYIVPVIMVQVGFVQLVPFILSVPWTFVFAAIPNTFQKIWTRQRLISALGGRGAYQNYMEFIDQMNRALIKKSPEHFLVPVAPVQQRMKVVSVRGSTVLQSFLGRLGFFKESVSVNSIRSFLMLKGFDDNLAVKSIMAMDAPSQLKVSLLVKTIYESGETQLIEGFEKHFKTSIKQLNYYRPWSGLQDWTLQMRQARNIQEIRRLLSLIPENVESREILAVWKNILLPAYADNFEIDYSSYRSLVREFEVFRAQSHQQGWRTWGEASFYFKEYLLNSQRGLMWWRSCSPTPQQVLDFLI